MPFRPSICHHDEACVTFICPPLEGKFSLSILHFLPQSTASVADHKAPLGAPLHLELLYIWSHAHFVKVNQLERLSLLSPILSRTSRHC